MPNNWNEVKEFTDRPKLPVNAYVAGQDVNERMPEKGRIFEAANL